MMKNYCIKAFRTALAGLAIMLLSACNNDIDEFKFKGYVVAGGFCSSSQPYYLIDILTPDSLGSAYGDYRHVVMAYKASRLLHGGDTVYGVGYFTEGYAALNCNMVPDNDYQEMILLSVDEEPF